MPNHFTGLPAAFRAEWDMRPSVLQPFRIENDTNRYWDVYAPDHRRVSSWECRPFPGCSALITTTQFQVFTPFTEQGIGRALRELQHKAYKRAGFNGEIATVRSDNAIMNAFMSGTVIDRFASDFGGTFQLWLTKFPTPAAYDPNNVRVTFQGRECVPASGEMVTVTRAPLAESVRMPNNTPLSYRANPPPPPPRTPFTYTQTPQPPMTRVVTPAPTPPKLYDHWPDNVQNR